MRRRDWHAARQALHEADQVSEGLPDASEVRLKLRTMRGKMP